MSAKPVHRDTARSVVVGAASIVVFLLVGYIGGLVQTGGALPGKGYTYVKADFSDVGILKRGKAVKQDGAQIGQISAISYDHGLARVTLRLEGDVPVYKDASAFVGNVSALGKKYVGFDPGHPSAGTLGDGVITVAHTKPSTSLEDVLSAFDPRTRSALRDAVGNLAQGTAGHGQDVNDLLAAAPAILKDVRSLTAAAAAPDAHLPELVSSADRLTGRFRDRTGELASLIDNTSVTLRAVGVDHGRPLETTVQRLPHALTSARSALDDLATPVADLHVALHNLAPGARALGAATPDLRGFLRDSPATLDLLPHVSGMAQPALSSLTTVVDDARPLVPTLTSTIDSASRLLWDFSPYAGDAGRFFSQNALLSGTLDGDPSKHYFAAQLTLPGLFSVGGAPDPTYRSEPYPCPLTAWNHATVTNCSGGAH